MTKVLLVEDSQEDLPLIQEMLGRAGSDQITATTATTLEQALHVLRGECFDVVLLDLNLPDSQGIDTLKKIMIKAQDIPIVVLTGVAEEAMGIAAVQEGAQDYLIKGQTNEILLMRTLRYAIERECMKKALGKAQEKLKQLFNASPDAIIITNLDAVIVDCSQMALTTFGYSSKEEVLGKSAFLFFSEDDRNRAVQNLQITLNQGTMRDIEYVMLRKDGSEFPIELSAGVMEDKHGNPLGLVCIAKDITKRKQAEESLSRREREYQILTENTGMGVYRNTPGPRGKFIEANLAIIKLFGCQDREEFLKLDVADLYQDPKDRETFNAKMLRDGHVRDEELHLKKKDGTPIVCAVSAVAVKDGKGEIRFYDGIIEDITAKKKTEEEFLKISKLESLAVLAGGLTHDLNNILMTVLGNITIARTFSKVDDNVLRRLEAAEVAVTRAKSMTQQLLTFAKGGISSKRTVSIKKVLVETADFVLSGSNVTWEFSIADDLWLVDIDEGKISQVVNNLVINAVQAMPNAGKIEIRAQNVSVGTQDGLPLQPGDYVKVSIKDQGIGIPAENLAKVFDPFFTTKSQGSGLGLAVAYSIIKNHGGYVTVESEMGIGSLFCFYLPKSEREKAALIEAAGLIAGKGKILVMDDDNETRDVIGAMLTHLGYGVIAARDGAEAITRFTEARDAGTPFDVVIMDLVIAGGMGGEQAIRKLLEIDPHVKAILISGYTGDRAISNYEDYGFKDFLAKPFKLEELSRVLHQVIGLG